MALSNLPAKVIAKAFRAGFHLTTQRAFPWPVGSSDRVVRYTLLDVRASGQAALIPLGAHRVCSTLPTGVWLLNCPGAVVKVDGGISRTCREGGLTDGDHSWSSPG